MKSKITKIQILKKGIALAMSAMFLVTPITYATTSLDDSYLESSILEQLLYGTIGSTVREIKEYFDSGKTTLYITNETQLRAFAEYINNGNDCSGKEIILLNDIEVDKENEWIPIGNETNPFKGTFNGNNYTISGIRISADNKTVAEASNSGLFGYVYGGKINKLRMSDICLYLDTNSDIKNVGSIVGYIENGEVSDCKTVGNDSEIKGESFVGGLVGKAVNSTIKNNINEFCVYSSDIVLGGIVGEINGGIIENCVNKANIKSECGDIGGIVGSAENTTIYNCLNENAVNGYASAEYVGGIAGTTGDTIIENCENTGYRVYGYNNVGGIVGSAHYSTTIKNSKNTARIVGVIEEEGTKSIGGIAGFGLSPIIEKCLNEGAIYKDGAAFIGWTNYSILEDDTIVYGKITNCINNFNYGGTDTGFMSFYSDTLDSYDSIQKQGCLNYSIKDGTSQLIKNITGDNVTQSYKISGKLTKSNLSSIVIDNFDDVYKFDATQGKIVFKDKVGYVGSVEDITADFGATNITYTIYKNGKAISEKEYFKAGDVIKVTANFDKYLAKTYGPLAAITDAPILKINNNTEMVAGKINASNTSYTTTIDYTYTIEDGENFDITSLNLYKNGTVYAVGSDYATVHPTISVASVSTSISNIIVDTTEPIINTKVYVENALETGRYTSGKDVIIEITTSEAIKGTFGVPAIQVNFSESGIGKYNYSKEENKVGYAKCSESKINLDGTTTWVYTYQIQEFDEGQIELAYKAGEIEDLAGNVTDIERLYLPQTPEISAPITGNEWTTELGVTYKFYKNSVSDKNEITSLTYLTEEDDLIVVATFDKVLYVHYGLSDGKNTNVRLNNTYKDRAPRLYLNGDSSLKSDANSVTTSDDSTSIRYTFDVATLGLTELTNVSKLVLKNENNNEAVTVNGTTASTNGLIPFANEWYSVYNSEDETKYNTTLTKDLIKTTNNIKNIVIDPIGVSTKIEQTDIYADTTAPTVEINADKSNLTNSELITYTFKFSEFVEGFTAEDITVNGGIKATEQITEGEETIEVVKFVEVVPGLEYILEVIPTITAGNEGVVQVIVEEGSVKDLVALGNVRQENNITIDKVVPTVEIKADKDYVQANEKITYTFTWSEKVKEFTEENITVVNGEIVEGTLIKVNDLQYTVAVNPTNGNDVEVWILKDSCEDLAGNKNTEAKNIITVIPTVEISTNANSNPTNVNQIEYTFTWSEQINGFDEKDIILPNGITGVFEKIDDVTYKMTVNYDSLIPNGNEGEVTIAVVEKAVKDSNGNENTYTTNTLKIDRIAPIFIGLEAYASSNITLDENIDVIKEYYRENDTITIVATFSENITEDTNLVLQFSESGNVKETIEGIVSEENKNKIIYTYTIKEGDNGILSVRALNGKVSDIAGNETIITKKTLDGNTIIADTTDPVLNELKVTSTQKANNAGDYITVEAIYSENVYALVTNEEGAKEIVDINIDNAPELKLTFGGKEAKGEITSIEYGYTDGKEDRTKLVYTYRVKGEEAEGDNGILAIVSYNEKENTSVCDIAGNEAIYNTYTKDTNEVYADTTRPIVEDIIAVGNSEVDNITHNGVGYYKAGSTIDVTVKANEVVATDVIDVYYAFKETQPTEDEYRKQLEGHLNINNSKEFNFTITVENGENGYLWIKVNENVFTDIAGNGNIKAETQKMSNVYADTIDPYFSTNSNGMSQFEVEFVKNSEGQVTGIKAVGIFNEKIFSIDGNSLVTLRDIPTTGVFVNNVLQKKIENPQVNVIDDKTVLTYQISATDIDTTGTISVNFIDGKVYDRAGNVMSIELVDGDITSPIFKDIKVVTPNGFYKAGEFIEIVARFEEETKLAAIPTLKIRVGNKVTELQGRYNAEDSENTDTIKVARYKYEVVSGDKGAINIVSLIGNVTDGIRGNNISQIYLDLNNDEVNDVNGRAEDLLNSIGSKYANDDTEYVNVIADTEAPTLIITSDAQKTNKDVVTYTFTWSEIVTGFTKDDIEVINASKAEFKQVDAEGKVYTLIVDTIEEGRQSIKVNAEVCEDRAGNLNSERVVFNGVVIDCTDPIIRAKVNGGNYVIATDTNKSLLKETIVVNEELSKFEYAWSTSEDIESITEWIEEDVSKIVVNSDINLETIANTEGTYYLYLRITDMAGNTLNARTKEFIVLNSIIELTADIKEITNQDVTVTVTYGDGLTEDRKAGISGKTQSADSSKVIVPENGIVYAEAMDKAGNKVYSTKSIDYIDKVAPEATIEYVTNEDTSVTASISFNEEDVTITNNSGKADHKFTENGEFTFEFKDKAGNIGAVVAKVTTIVPRDEIAPNIIFNYTLSNVTLGNPIGATILTDEDANISYKWDDGEWITSEEYITSINVTYEPKFEKVYTLYAKATDKAGNTSDIQKLEFTVIEEIKIPEIIFEDLPTVQVNGIKYVKVSADMTVEMITSKMNTEALCGKTPEYLKLTEEGKIKTGSEIAINRITKYVIVVNGDVNCDGEISFLGDVVMANNYRIGQINLTTVQKLAADVNNSGVIEFISDIVAINNYRLGIIKSL